MKNFNQLTMKNTALALIILLLFSSCSDLLDIDAENTLSGDVLNNESNIQKSLNGAYLNLYGIADGIDGGELFGGDFKVMATLLTRQNVTEISWDETNAPDYEDFIDKDIRSINLRVEANWRRGYETISIVNDILANIQNVSDQSARNRIQGEALAMRGMLYFEMVRFWGPQYQSSSTSDLGIPLILDPINSLQDVKTPNLETVENLYTQIETDLTQASGLLEAFGTNNGNISYYACEAYLAKVLMQKNEYSAELLTHLDNVIGGPFSLRPTPFEAFNNASNQSEDILAVQQTPTSNSGDNSSGSGVSTLYTSLPNFGLSAMRTFESALNNPFFLDNNPQFLRTDLRAQIFNGTSESSTPDDISTLFYLDPVNTLTISSAKYLRNTDVLPIIRLSDILLRRAEAQLEFDFLTTIDPQALNDLNLIRVRAGLPALLDTLTPFQFYDSLVLERNRELIHEGELFHDLKRWRALGNSATITFSNNPLDQKFILPIPQAECDASPGLCD